MPPERLTGEIPAGLTTLRRWASRHGRSAAYVQNFWRRNPDFPDPVGELPSRARHGGGHGELVFSEDELDAWLAAQPNLAPPERIDPAAIEIAPDQRITLGRFAKLIGKDRKTVTQHRDRAGFPTSGPDGTYRFADLLKYWNSRPGRRR